MDQPAKTKLVDGPYPAGRPSTCVFICYQTQSPLTVSVVSSQSYPFLLLYSPYVLGLFGHIRCPQDFVFRRGIGTMDLALAMGVQLFIDVLI